MKRIISILMFMMILPICYASIGINFENNSYHPWEVPITVNTSYSNSNISVAVIEKGDSYDFNKPIMIFYDSSANTNYDFNFITTYPDTTVASSSKKTEVHFDNKTGVLDDEIQTTNYVAYGSPEYNQTGGVIQGAYYFDADETGSTYVEQYTTSWYWNRVDFSACAWVYYYGKEANSSNWYISSGQYWGNSLGSDAGNMYIRNIVSSNVYTLNMDDTSRSSTEVIVLNKWNFVCWTWDLNVASKLYIDGELVYTSTGTPDAYNDDESYYSTFGKSKRSFSGSAIAWNGSVDEAMYWFNDVLTESEINSIYTFNETEYCFKVQVDYTGGSETSEEYCFQKDLTIPEVEIIKPDVYEAESSYIEVNASDEYNISLSVYLNGDLIGYIDKNSTSQTYINNTLLPKGRYNLTVEAEDQAGNVGTETYFFDIIGINNIKIYSEEENVNINIFSNILNTILNIFGG